MKKAIIMLMPVFIYSLTTGVSFGKIEEGSGEGSQGKFRSIKIINKNQQSKGIKVTNLKVIVRPTKYTGKCPHKFTFYGRITAVGSGLVKYKWIRSDHALTPVKNLFFRSSGTKTVTTTWTIGAAGKTYKNYWQAIKIISPVYKTSNKAKFSLKCSAPTGSLPPGSGIGTRDDRSIHRLITDGIKIQKPRGGETYLTNGMIPLRWNTINQDCAGKVSVYAIKIPGRTEIPIVKNLQSNKGINHFRWDIPERGLSSGSYKIKIKSKYCLAMSKAITLSANYPEFGIKSVTVNHRNGGPIRGILNYGNRGKPLPVDIKLGLTWNKCLPIGNISCKNSLYIKFGGKDIPFPNNIVPMNPTKFRNGVFNKKIQVSLPGGFRPGTTQTLRCELRPSASGCDGSPANNTILKSFTIGDADCMKLQMGLIKPSPDLTAHRVLGPVVSRKRPGTVGSKYRITYKVFIKYIPSERMPNCHLKDVTFRIAIYLKNENRVIRRRVGVVKDFTPGFYTQEFTQHVDDDLKNKHVYIILEVDPWKKITEEDETNNTYKSRELLVKE